MKLRTEDALGYFSAQMLGQIALPHVTKTAAQEDAEAHPSLARVRALVAERVSRDPVGTDSASSFGLPQTRNGDPAPSEDPTDRVESEFAQRLGVCGCGNPMAAMQTLLQVLGSLHTSTPSELPTGMHMLALYLLDEKELIEHGGSLYGAWLTKKGLDLLGWLEQQKDLGSEKKIHAEYHSDGPVPAEVMEQIQKGYPGLVMGNSRTRVCACSRVVPESEWVYPYDCCSECADHAANVGDNWREFTREEERLRLLGDFTD